MKTISKYIAIIVAIVIATSATTTYALKWSMSKELDIGNFQEIKMSMLGIGGIRVVKFQDENNICYMAFPQLNNNVGTPSLSCNIK